MHFRLTRNVVTGASRGIGKQIALGLAREGAHVATPRSADALAVLDSPDLRERRVRRIPARRMGDPAEIVALVCLLASPLSDFVTGSTYVIDGGEAAKL